MIPGTSAGACPDVLIISAVADVPSLTLLLLLALLLRFLGSKV
jgi:hypothetical protein